MEMTPIKLPRQVSTTRPVAAATKAELARYVREVREYAGSDYPPARAQLWWVP